MIPRVIKSLYSQMVTEEEVPKAYLRSVEVCPALRQECWVNRTVEASAANAVPRYWFRLPYHFDNYVAALLTLYETATLEGWVDIMYRANDITGIDMGPCRDRSGYFAAFFVLYIMVCSFFALNLFMSVVIENFQKQIAEGVFTPQQLEFISHICHMFSKRSVTPPPNLPQCACSVWLREHVFDTFIMSLIAGNLLFTCTSTVDYDHFEDYRELVDRVPGRRCPGPCRGVLDGS